MDAKLVLGLTIGVIVLVGATGGTEALVHVGNGVRDVLHWITHDVFDWIKTFWNSVVGSRS